MIEPTQSAARPAKPCHHCSTIFTPKRSNGKYCHKTCAQAARRKSKPSTPKRLTKTVLVTCTGESCTKTARKERGKTYTCQPCRSKEAEANALGKFYRSRFFEQLLRDCQRAETLEVFNTLDDISFYRRLRKKLTKVNGYCFKDPDTEQDRHYEYHICHRVAVVNGSSKYIGNFSEENLFIGPASLNRKYGNKEIYQHPQVGLNCIERYNLNPRYRVTSETTSADFQALLTLRFGYNNLEAWAHRTKLRPRSDITWEDRPIEDHWPHSAVLADAFQDDITINPLDRFDLLERICMATNGEDDRPWHAQNPYDLVDTFKVYPEFSQAIVDHQFTGDDIHLVNAYDSLSFEWEM